MVRCRPRRVASVPRCPESRERRLSAGITLSWQLRKATFDFAACRAVPRRTADPPAQSYIASSLLCRTLAAVSKWMHPRFHSDCYCRVILRFYRSKGQCYFENYLITTSVPGSVGVVQGTVGKRTFAHCRFQANSTTHSASIASAGSEPRFCPIFGP